MITNQQLNGLTDRDFYAIKRVMTKLPTDGLEVSPIGKILISLLSDPFTSQATAQQLFAIRDIGNRVLWFDPNKKFEEHANYQNDDIQWLHDITVIYKPQYLISEYPVYANGMNMLIGKPGTGKSLIAIDFLAKAALAYPNHKFLYAAAEDYSGIVIRWKAWEKHHKVKFKNVGFLRHPPQFADPEQVAKFEASVSENQVNFIVIDTLQAVTVGIDENSTKEMSKFADSVLTLCEKLRLGVLFIHHENKRGEYRGSSVLHAQSDSMIRCVDEDGLLKLLNSNSDGGKNKSNTPPDPIYKRIISVEITLDDGKVDTVAVLEAAERVIDDPNTVIGNARRILEALDGLPDGLQAKELSSITNITQSSIYYALKKLTSRGLVSQKLDRYLITEEGRKAL